MKGFINVAKASAMCCGKTINAASNPWEIEAKHKHLCLCQRVCETLCASDPYCIKDSYLYQTGIKKFELCGKTLIDVGYGINIKYIDCDGNNKTVAKEDSVVFFEPPKIFCEHLAVHIPNPPCVKVCDKKIIAEFAVILCK